MRDLKTIGEDHVHSGDGWRGWDGMIRWEELGQLTKRQMNRKGSDNQMTDLKINWPHIPSGDGWRGWDGMIRWETLNQLTKITYCLEWMGWDDETRNLKTIDQDHVLPGDGWRGRMIRWEVLNLFTKFTYPLETDEEDEMRWWDEKS